MGDFGYSTRANAVNEAHDEVHASFKEVTKRNDQSDPRTRRWLDAIETFRAAYARVYPEALRKVDRGESRAADIDTADMLDFLEADPMFDRSGYMKEKLLTELKRRTLTKSDVARLQTVILGVVQRSSHRREFLRYCRTAANVDDVEFRSKLLALEYSTNAGVSQRANWVLAALEGKWPELRRASRGQEKRGELYYSVSNPRIDRT